MTVPNNVEVDGLHVHYDVFEDSSAGLKQIFASGVFRRRARRIHAVRGVSFDIKEGESFGIIGGNGAGKSTLLAAMTGLLPTSSGEVRVRTRPSLLGVSAALRPSLSGRRNITIGCLALGMSTDEVGERIDEIIDFAGLRDSIDLPMRTYSSGMRARLNFSIATAVIPKILLVDEALAVGDAEFRQRSQDRIDHIRATAGSVVLVSHNLEEVRRACDRALWLEKGEVRLLGSAGEVIDAYLDDRIPAVAGNPQPRPIERAPELVPETSAGTALLHIGVAGADGALIQAALHSRREEVLRSKINYTSLLGRRDHSLGRYGTPPGGPDEPSYDAWLDWCEGFRERFLDGLAGFRGLIASSSALGQLDESGIGRVRDLLNEAGIDRVQAVLFVRRQDELACLIHRNRVQRGWVEPFSLGEHLANEVRYDFAAMAKRWSTVIGAENLHVRLHKDRDELDSNVNRFIELAGFAHGDDEAGVADESNNRPELISAIRELNTRRKGGPIVPWYKVFPDGVPGREGFGLSVEDGRAILARFRSSNEAVLAYVPEKERIASYFDQPMNISAPERQHRPQDTMELLELVSSQLEVATRELADLRGARSD